jgi:hypothetical protein
LPGGKPVTDGSVNQFVGGRLYRNSKEHVGGYLLQPNGIARIIGLYRRDGAGKSGRSSGGLNRMTKVRFSELHADDGDCFVAAFP